MSDKYKIGEQVLVPRKSWGYTSRRDGMLKCVVVEVGTTCRTRSAPLVRIAPMSGVDKAVRRWFHPNNLTRTKAGAS